MTSTFHDRMEQELEQLRSEAVSAIEQVADRRQLEDFRIKYLGRNGQISALMKQLGSAAKEDRPRLGKLANTTRSELEKLF